MIGREAIYRNACATVLRRSDVAVLGDPRTAAEELAELTGLGPDDIIADPVLVAARAVEELDWMARDARR